MQDNAIRTDISDLRLSAVLFDEAFRIHANKQPRPQPLTPPHRHADYEIFFLLEGELTVRGEGEQIRAKSPSAVILPPLFHHVTEYQISHGYCMYFRLEQKPKGSRILFEKAEKTLNRGITVLPLEDEARFYIEQLAKTVSSPFAKNKEHHLVALLFSELLQGLLTEERETEPHKHIHDINIIELFISEHYREKIRLTDLADTLHLCPKQVTRIIRKKFGCSFSDLVRDHRLALARTMLRSTENSIAAIAEEVGYEYTNYFYTLFRKAYGMTPQDYRKANRNNTIE